jgi:hypothetical protein
MLSQLERPYQELSHNARVPVRCSALWTESCPTTSVVQELQVSVSQAIAKTGHFHQVDMSYNRPPSSRIGDELMTVQVSDVRDVFRLFFCVFELVVVALKEECKN